MSDDDRPGRHWAPPLETVPNPITTVDRAGRILYLNHTFTGEPPENAYGLCLYDVIPPDERPKLAEVLATVFEEGKTTLYEAFADPPGRWYEGRLAPLLRDGKIVAAVIVSTDVTDHKKTRLALESSERNFRKITEQLPDGVIIHRNGTIEYVNPATAILLGWPTPEALQGLLIIDQIHEEDREVIKERMRIMRETGEPVPPIELKMLRKDGGVVVVETAPVQFVELEGGPATLVLFRDVTQKKKMQDRLLLADRVASMGNLAAGLAHEINNPLTYVIGNLSLAARILVDHSAIPSNLPTHELQKALADARSGAERVRHIVGDLRAFSTPDRGEIVPVDLRKVLDAAINVAWSEIRHRARLVREYGDTPNVLGSETRLGQVFLNLLVNAAQAIDEGDATKHQIRVITRTDELGRAHVEVCDSGRGFTRETAARMFDPFYTTKPAGEGTGLGLSICQSIVTALGGDIWGEKNSDRGSTFHVILAPSKAQSLASAVRLPAVPAGELRRGRILVVDDEPVIAAMVRRALDGHDIYLMTSGRDALELCREMSFDLIIADLLMPDLTGMDLYESLRTVSPGLEERIVFMTAGAFTTRARAFLAQVANTVVEKPFDIEHLQAVVQSRLQALATGASS